MMADQAQESAHHDHGIGFPERTFAGALAKVAAQQSVNWPHLGLHEQLRQFVAFQTAEQEQSKQSRLFPVGLQNAESECLEDSRVVALVHCVSQFFEELLAMALDNEINDGGVKVLFGGK